MINQAVRKEQRPGESGHPVRRAFRNSVFLLAFVFFFFASSAFSQLTTADIVGTVTDATGALVPNAAVVLTNLGTNEKRTGQSNNQSYPNKWLLPVHQCFPVKLDCVIVPTVEFRLTFRFSSTLMLEFTALMFTRELRFC